MKILFIVTQPFPYGMASTNRLRSLTTGFTANGQRVRIICLKPTTLTENIEFMSGSRIACFEGVEFEYTSPVIQDSRIKMIKAVYLILGILYSLFRIIQINKKQNVDQIWVSFSTIPYLIPYFVMSKMIKSQFTLFRSEYPALERNWLSMIPYNYFYSKFIYKVFDNFVIMTVRLKEYFDSRKRLDARSILAPMTLDFSKFDAVDHRQSDCEIEYIAYSGTMNFHKDGVDNLLRAFKEIAQFYPGLLLYLIGDLESNTHAKNLIHELGISGRIISTGYVTGQDYVDYLIKAKVLCLARPRNEQNEIGFPSKLIEYFATGNPVITTNVGEISNYFKDNKSVFFARSENYLDFSEKIRFVLDNYNEARVVGQNGREIAKLNFDYRTVTKRICEQIIE